MIAWSSFLTDAVGCAHVAASRPANMASIAINFLGEFNFIVILVVLC
jgi:hypothetical protein